MALQKAQIEILDKAAVDPSRGLYDKIEVQFNPTEYSLNKEAQIAEIPVYGIDSPILQFIRGQNEKLTLDLFFDTTRPKEGEQESGMAEKNVVDVRDKTRSIYQLVKMQPNTHAIPRIRFHWGNGISFKAIVESVQQRFTLFSPLGIPLRATLTVSFREYKTLEDQLSELNLKSADHSKFVTVKQGDTLSHIAAAQYNDPSLWRVIAGRNKISNPRLLQPGTVLEIPPLQRGAAHSSGG